MLTYDEVTQSEAIRTYITRADQSLAAWAIQSTALPT